MDRIKNIVETLILIVILVPLVIKTVLIRFSAGLGDFWTAVGAIATVLTFSAVFFAARQLQLEAWLKAQEIFTKDDFTKAMGKVFSHLSNDSSRWEQEDQEAGLIVCRGMDEFCHLAPYFGFTKSEGEKKVLDVWDDPIGKSWVLLEALVMKERKKVKWNTKWNAFDDLGRKAFLRFSKDKQKEPKETADRLKPQIEQLMGSNSVKPSPDDFTPLCPHCNKEVKEPIAKKVTTGISWRCVYCCPYCKKILSVGNEGK